MFMSKKSKAKIDLNFLRPSPCTDKKWKSPMQLNRLCNVKLHVFKSSAERTYNSDNENIYHPKFAWYAERSSFIIGRYQSKVISFDSF